jgi:7-carboxy-7-deazaguanine synthase
MTYLVNEVFPTIQCEATHTGTPAVFIRLQGCRVGCAFCDTKHTWQAPPANQVPLDAVLRKGATPESTFAVMETGDLVALVAAMAGAARLVVLTGGEPADHDLRPLSEALEAEGYHVQVETSGTSPLLVTRATWVTLSPKVNQAGGLVVLDEVLARADEIKHPTSTERHLRELQDLLARGRHRLGVPVWLQPLSQHPAATTRCAAWCQEFGYRLSLQVHKYANLR